MVNRPIFLCLGSAKIESHEDAWEAVESLIGVDGRHEPCFLKEGHRADVGHGGGRSLSCQRANNSAALSRR